MIKLPARNKKDEKARMQIRKVYTNVNPGLLYDEIRDFVQKYGLVIDEAKLETYSMPNDSSSFIHRGTLTFMTKGQSGKAAKESLRAHIVGSARGETKLILDIDEKLFPEAKVTALQEDLDFIFGSYEVKPR
jgi:hypothetical protein